MAVLNYSTVISNKSSFTPGQDTKLLISPAYSRGATVPYTLIEIKANATAIGTGATATVTVTNGVITDIQITNGGSGYVDSAVIAFTGTGSGASATLVVVGGVVTDFTDLVGGTGYGSSGTTAAITGFINSTGAISVGTNELVLKNTSTIDLYEGTRIPFIDSGVVKPVYVSQYTPAGSAGVPILPSQYAIAVTATAQLKAYVPLLSANQLNFDQKPDIIQELNFSSGFFYQKAVVGIDASSSTQGTQVYGDPALKILQKANLAGQYVYVTVLKGNQRGGYSFEAIIAGLPESVQRNGFYQQTVNLEPSGGLEYFTY